MREPNVDSDVDSVWNAVDRLSCIRGRTQDVTVQCDEAVIVLMHAHVSLEDALDTVQATSRIALITCPCCEWLLQHTMPWACSRCGLYRCLHPEQHAGAPRVGQRCGHRKRLQPLATKHKGEEGKKEATNDAKEKAMHKTNGQR